MVEMAKVMKRIEVVSQSKSRKKEERITRQERVKQKANA